MPDPTGRPDDAVFEMADVEFELLRAFIRRATGIQFLPAKKTMLAARLSGRLRALGLRSFGAYHRLLADGKEQAERLRLFDCICTNETHFFREPTHFEYLEQRIFPQWAERGDRIPGAKRLRLLSAACSTGEEPYTLAMLAALRFPAAAGWSVEVLGVDLSSTALAQAEQATWPIQRASEIPGSYLKRFMLRGVASQDGWMRAGQELRPLVRFRRQNLYDQAYAISGPFDAIFCRNVLIYFDAESRKHVVERLLDLLAPSGHLFIGHAETLNGITDLARPVAPTIYVRRSPRFAVASPRSTAAATGRQP